MLTYFTNYPIDTIVLRKNDNAILYRCEYLDPSNSYIFYKIVNIKDRTFYTCIKISDAYKLFDKIEKED